MQHILVIVNKEWEADALCGIIANDYARPVLLQRPRAIKWRASRKTRTRPNRYSTPRVKFVTNRASVSIWCLDDLIDCREESSETRNKIRALEELRSRVHETDNNVVVSVGTASSPMNGAINGSVVVGTRTICREAGSSILSEHAGLHVEDNNGILRPADDNMAVRPAQRCAMVRVATIRETIRRKLLPAPVGGSDLPMVEIDVDHVAGSFCHVTNKRDYERYFLDLEATAKGDGGSVKSVDTTHAVVQIVMGEPFIFVSGFSDRRGRFHQEVKAREYAQKFAASHNAGMVAAYLLAEMLH